MAQQKLTCDASSVMLAFEVHMRNWGNITTSAELFVGKQAKEQRYLGKYEKNYDLNLQQQTVQTSNMNEETWNCT